ncbi:MAG TPA: PP2C family protein-serine/threonine phosphatase [Acidimicrobiales bacterium]|nr:PP2C family protein-serine/threonine phosphatase [Acidimicrobiales bacterium]
MLGTGTLVLLVLVDLCYHRQVNFSGAVVVAPVLAAALARPGIVAGVGGLAAGGSVGLSWYDGSLQGWLAKMLVVVAGTVLGVLTARHRRSLQDRAVRLKSVADAAESALLRPLPSRVGPASMAGWHVAATLEARVGGDFYEAVPYSTRARWVIGDARGHGVEAIRLGAAVLGAFREAAGRMASLEEVAARVEESLLGFLGDEDFVTAVFGELHQDGTLRIINCGHPPPLLLGSRGARRLTVQSTTPLGIEPDLTTRTLRLSPGDSVCFHTDGLEEVRTAAGRGLDPGALGAGLSGASAEEAAAAVRHRLRAETGGGRFDDDVSVLVVKYLPLADVNRPRLRAVPATTVAAGQVP